MLLHATTSQRLVFQQQDLSNNISTNTVPTIYLANIFHVHCLACFGVLSISGRDDLFHKTLHGVSIAEENVLVGNIRIH